MTQYRQGDVFLVKVDDLPAESTLTEVPRDKGRVILAYGEVTGHAHAIRAKGATLYEGENDQRFLRITDPTPLTHEEHGRIDIEPGDYRVVIQREYVDDVTSEMPSAMRERRVVD